MNKIISFVILVLFISANVYSYTWTRTLGGVGNDCGYSICFAQDSGYILAGYTESQGAGMTDGWLIKTDTFGLPVWSKTFGGTDSDCIYSVTKTMDSGYIMTGYTKSFGAGGSDVWIIKTDANGDTIWTRTYGDSNNECAYSIINAIDSGYVAVGTRNSGEHAWLLKVNTDGDTVWTQTFQKYGYGRCVQQTNDSGYIITGYSDFLVYIKTASWLIKIDANGNTLWPKIFDTYNCQLYSVAQTKDSGYIMTGTKTIDTYNALWVVKTDFLGSEIPSYAYAVWGVIGTGYSIAETNSGNYIIAGSGNTATSYFSWDNEYTNAFEGAYADSDGAIIVKTNTDYGDYGDRLGYFGGKYANGAYSFLQTPDGAYIMLGYTDSYGEGKRDLWRIRTEDDKWEGRTPAIEENSSDKNSSPSISVSPNPCINSTTISFTVPSITLTTDHCPLVTVRLYDISGREKMRLFEGNIKTKNMLTLNTNSLASGKYFLKMEAGGKKTIKGITIVK